jgi:hypothetical protein
MVRAPEFSRHEPNFRWIPIIQFCSSAPDRARQAGILVQKTKKTVPCPENTNSASLTAMAALLTNMEPRWRKRRGENENRNAKATSSRLGHRHTAVPGKSRHASCPHASHHDIMLFGTSIFTPAGLYTVSSYPFISTYEHGALTALGDGGSVVWRNQGGFFSRGPRDRT